MDCDRFMCISPVSIKNPNYGLKHLSKFKDTTSQMIRVPCGYCPECIHTKQMGIIQRMRMESTKNHLFFCTLTYRDLSLPHVQTSTGYLIRYAKIKDVQDMMKRLRKSNAFGRPFRYFGVTELGSKRSRPHFHLIFMIKKQDSDDYNTCLNLEKTLHDAVLKEWRRNIGRVRFPLYQPLCDFVQLYKRGRLSSTFDLHYVRSNGVDNYDDVGFYVIKYMLKPSDNVRKLQQALRLNLDEIEYSQIWNMVKPRTFKSLDFGLPDDEDVKKKLKHDIKKSYSLDFPSFFNNDGTTWPLSKYYKSKGEIYSASDAAHFFKNQVPDSKTIQQTKLIVRKYEKQVKTSFLRGNSALFDELFDCKQDSCQSLE